MSRRNPPPGAMIRVNLAHRPRTLAAGLTVLCIVAVGLALIYIKNVEAAAPYLGTPVPEILGGAIGGLIGAGCKPYLVRLLMTYDPATRVLRARDWFSGRLRVYPREGFIRLERSDRTGDFYQVRADGTRKRIPLNINGVNAADWWRFVEQFDRDHRPVETDRS